MPPRSLLLKTLELFDGFTGFAVELGCGGGVDTIKLIDSGWKVYAVDATPYGYENIKTNISKDKLGAFEFKQEFFEYLDIPATDLVYSSLSIPFCNLDYFDSFWSRITAAIKVGGRFSGHLFGDKDEWAQKRPDMTFKTREQVYDLLKGFDIEYLNEEYEESPAQFKTIKQWHLFEIIAKKTTC